MQSGSEEEGGDGPKVWFGQPLDGTTVASPVHLALNVEGAESGHLHVVVDGSCVHPGRMIPADATYLHFGRQSSEATLDLPAGEHRLCLQLGDRSHRALPATDEITVSVSG